jgi:hypothetical protein
MHPAKVDIVLHSKFLFEKLYFFSLVSDLLRYRSCPDFSGCTALAKFSLRVLFLLLFSRAKKVRKRALALCIIGLPISALFRKFKKLVVPPQTVPNFF